MLGFLQLGRLGDLCECLKMALDESRKGNPATIFCAPEFAPLMQGVSYCECVAIPFTADQLFDAETWVRNKFPSYDLRICQPWKNKDQRHLTANFQREQWRLAAKLYAFGTVGLRFDRRNPAREAEFVNRLWSPTSTKPLILVATQSPSSPFRWGGELLEALNDAFRDTHTVVDLSLDFCRAPMPYDLLGLFDRAALLVTIDSFQMHLAEASTCPVIAIVNDVGTSATPGPWAASVAPPQAVATLRYSDWIRSGGAANVLALMKAQEALTFPWDNPPRIIHAVDMHGTSARHARAQDSWVDLFDGGTYAWEQMFSRNAKGIGDARELPYLKDLLSVVINESSPDDIIFWSNSDNSFSPNLPVFLRKHVSLYGACSFHRTEKGSVGHTGRDGFAFTKRWLTSHWDALPDFILGAGGFDLCLAALIRLERGIVTTKANLAHDFWPCDIPGMVHHEAHESAWTKDMDSPSNRWNRSKLREWSAKNIPTLKFYPNNHLAQ